jgi:hypothetical protein
VIPLTCCAAVITCGCMLHIRRFAQQYKHTTTNRRIREGNILNCIVEGSAAVSYTNFEVFDDDHTDRNVYCTSHLIFKVNFNILTAVALEMAK